MGKSSPQMESELEQVFLTRANKVHDMVLYGYSKYQIIAYCAKEWGLDKDAAMALITESNRRFREIAKIEKDIEKGKSLARLEKLINKSLEISDISKALSSQQEINKLLALYAAQEPTTTNVNLTTLSDAELLKIAGGQINNDPE
jgi:hypothetical protein